MAKVQINTQENGRSVVNTSVDRSSYGIGDVLPDGWVVGGISPVTGRVMSVEPEATALQGYQTWYKGEDRAEELRSQGHAGARQPYVSELKALYNDIVKADRNQHAQFETADFKNRYWSGSDGFGYQTGKHSALVRRMEEHIWDDQHVKRHDYARVRCVRDEPDITLA